MEDVLRVVVKAVKRFSAKTVNALAVAEPRTSANAVEHHTDPGVIILLDVVTEDPVIVTGPKGLRFSSNGLLRLSSGIH